MMSSKNTKNSPVGKSNIKSECVVVVSDLHVGSIYGLCPKKVKIDSGGTYLCNDLQRKILNVWNEFWDNIKKEFLYNLDKFDLVINGDLIEGNHHGTKTAWSNNISDQIKASLELFTEKLEDVHDHLNNIFVIRGTEAHVGKSGEFEDLFNELLKSNFPKLNIKHSYYELFTTFGKNNNLCHFTHHTSVGSGKFFEVNCLIKEFDHVMTDSARWGKLNKIPKYLIRSHCHRACVVEIPTESESVLGITTPCWQVKTPFVYKVSSSKNYRSHIGGVVLYEDEYVMKPACKMYVRGI